MLMLIANAVAATGPIVLGEKSEVVRAIQNALSAYGASLVPDGDFGTITEAAVKRLQAAHGLQVMGYVGPKTAALLDHPPGAASAALLPSVLTVAPHLSVMRAITGTKEFPGGADNPIILSWVATIITKFPELKAGVGWYKHDATAWCGLGMAYSVAMAGLRPPLEPLWALNWHDDWKDGVKLAGRAVGAIAALPRSGGGHVTAYEGEDSTHWFGRGCNQSDAVNVARFPLARIPRDWMWPRGLALPVIGRFRTSFDAAVSVREA